MTMDTKLDITIAIPVLNEENNLAGCLKAIGNDFAQQVVVIDSGSTDNTRQIATSLGAQVIDFRWDGKFPKKRNWYLRRHTPKTKWVLFLDADEYITDEVKQEIAYKLNSEDKSGYWLSYKIYFMDKPLKGGYPLQKLALFKVGAGEYERIDEERWSNLDMEVHEHPVIKGALGKIKARIDHRDFRGIAHYITKHNEYSDWEARKVLRDMQADHTSRLTWKQKFKYGIIKTPMAGVIYFIGSYVFMGGFLDGARGLAFAILKMSYFTQVYGKIKEIEISRQ
jgi:glycosyltransferase involved in cell wall biosynthesis